MDTTRAKQHRSLLPREHGSYGQLLFPLINGLALGEINLAACVLSLAPLCGLFAHEPLLVALGQRGRRVRRQQGRRALLWLGPLGGGAIISVTAGLVLAPGLARLLLIVPLFLAASLLGFIASRRERTTWGEVVAALALSSWVLPVALAGKAQLAHAVACWVVWGGAFTVATVAVRAVLLLNDQRTSSALVPTTVSLAVLTLAATGVLAGIGILPPITPLALCPICLLALALTAFPPPLSKLRTVGWSLMGSSTMTLILLLVGLG